MASEVTSDPGAAEVLAVPGGLESRITELSQKVDRISEILEEFDRRREVLEQLREDLKPMATGAMRTAIRKLGDLEQNGTLAVVHEAIRVLERIPVTLSEADVQLLGDNIAHLLFTAKNLTQPEMLDLADREASALRSAQEARPVGLVGLLRSLRDPEVKKGMGVLVELLRGLGKDAPSPAS